MNYDPSQSWRYRKISFLISDVDIQTNRLDNSRSLHMQMAVEQDDGSFEIIWEDSSSVLTISEKVRDFLYMHYGHMSTEWMAAYESRIALTPGEIKLRDSWNINR